VSPKAAAAAVAAVVAAVAAAVALKTTTTLVDRETGPKKRDPEHRRRAFFLGVYLPWQTNFPGKFYKFRPSFQIY